MRHAALPVVCAAFVSCQSEAPRAQVADPAAPSARTSTNHAPAAANAGVAASTTSSAPGTPAASGLEDVRAWLSVRAPSSARLAPDGALFVRDWPDGVNQVYRAAKPGEPFERLTSFPDGASSFSLSPDGSKLLVAAAIGGNEQDQVFSIDLAATPRAKPAALLFDRKVVHRVHAWLDDSSGFFYSANDVSPNDFHVYRCDLAKDGGEPKRTKVLAAEGSWSAPAVSRRGDRVLVRRNVSESDSQLSELEVATGVVTTFRAGTEPTTNTNAVGYLDDDASVVCTSDADGGTRRVWVWHPKTGATVRPLAALERFEIDDAAMNRERTLLAVATNEAGYGVLHVFRLPGFEEIALPPIERGVATVQHVERSAVVFTIANAHNPGLTYACDVSAGRATTARTLTTATAQGVDLARAVEPALVSFRSSDGLEVPAFLYAPAGRRDGERAPFVVHYHGGPEGQHRPAFDRTAQVLASRGIGVIQPNVRGSTGYGRTFHQLDDVAKRMDSVKDGVAAARWLVEKGYARAGRIATYGGSYGGFMSVACLLEGRELFGAGVDVVGIVNFESFLEQTKGYRRKLREVEYGSLDDRDFLRSISPIHRASEIAVPMMIAHGLNDPRVPVGEAMQLAVALQRRGFDPELVFCPDEGHGFQKHDNRVLFTERMVRFLERTIAR